MSERLEDIAAKMVASGQGVLAADESNGTATKRFEALGIPSTEETRRDYREMLFRAGDSLRDYISGVILYDETIRQSAADGTPIPQLIKNLGGFPGIKVDTGAKPLALADNETITEGLDGLRERLADYGKLGAQFAKWRAVITIGDGRPSRNAIGANAHALARYAALCQEAGIVPIVEPEVLMDGPGTTHDVDTCYDVTELTLRTVFQALYEANVSLEGIVLKPSMVIAAKGASKQAGPQEVAEKTIRVLRACVPAAVPGIAFLSGGQADELATEHLSLMNDLGSAPWNLTFSYGRALQHAAMTTWRGKSENVAAAQQAFSHRAKMNSLASLGKWSTAEEKAAA